MSRLQVVLYSRLVAEVVGTFRYVDQVWGDWCIARWKAGLPLGGSVINGIGYRAWPVPVGGCIQCGSVTPCAHDVEVAA